MTKRGRRGRSTTAAVPHVAVTQRTTRQTTRGPITLFCLVCGDDVENAFKVVIERDKDLDDLKNAIKEKAAPRFNQVAAHELVLWSVDISEEEEDAFKQLQNDEIEDLGGVKLKYMTKQVGATFSSVTPGCIHVIIERPPDTAQESEKDKKLIESVITATLKRQREEEPVTISSMSSLNKKQRIIAKYGLSSKVVNVSHLFDDLPLVGDEPGLFKWDEQTENQQATRYTDFIRDAFLGPDDLGDNVLQNVHGDKNYLNTIHLHGGCDVSVYRQAKPLIHKSGIILVIEVKKELEGRHTNQALGELIAANLISTEKPVAMLTDFQTFYFFWIGHNDQSQPTIFATGFADRHKAATFARMVLNPELEEIPDDFPTYEQRATLEEVNEVEQDDDDVGNLDDFIDEMTPLERKAHKINKNLRWIHRHIPPAFCESLAHKVIVHNGVLENLY